MHRTEKILLLAVFLIALAVRLAHIGGPLYVPDWRESTTAYMAYRMAQETPPDILRPKVVYRGGDDVRVSEFPIYSFLVELVYKALGTAENLAAARGVNLLFFAGAAAYLFRTVRLLFGRRDAWYAVAAYSTLPIGLHYSCGVHYDMSLVFFSHGFFYHGLRFMERPSVRSFLPSTVMGAMAFLMKAPYAFYFGLPMLVYALAGRERRPVRDALRVCALFVLPLVAAWGFNEWRIAVEGDAPNSLLHAQKWTHGSSVRWFFGDLASRTNPAHWKLLINNAVFIVLTPAGALAAPAAFLLPRWRGRGMPVVLAWCAGVFAYVLLVFKMVVTHEYYLNPLLAPAAALVGLFASFLAAGKRGESARPVGVALAAVLFALLWFGTAAKIHGVRGMMSGRYFQRDHLRIEAGRVIRQSTPDDALVLAICKGRWTAATDPRLLYQARRRGWSMPLDELTPQAVSVFLEGGATHAAVMTTSDFPADDHLYPLLAGYPHTAHGLAGPRGEALGQLVLFKLR